VCEIAVNGEALVADPMGALYWPREGALIVSDLHFEKGSSFARRGLMLPPYDTRTTLKRLAALRRRYAPNAIVSLGDAFHDDAAEARLDAVDADLLADLMAGLRWVWVLGNHDPAPPQRFAAETHTELRVGGLVFRHDPRPGAAPGELAGHLHPCARVRTEWRTQRRRCFATDGVRIVLPAFGAYAGGLNVLDDAFAPLFAAPTAYVLGAKGVYAFAHDLLVGDLSGAARIAG
jgi:hypothetical protein